VVRHCGVLLSWRQFAMQRQQDEPASLLASAKGLDRLRDFKAARHEHQHIAFAARTTKSRKAPAAAPRPGGGPNKRAGGELDFNRKRPSLRLDNPTRLQIFLQPDTSSVADITSTFRSGRPCSCKSSARPKVMSP